MIQCEELLDHVCGLDCEMFNGNYDFPKVNLNEMVGDSSLKP